MGGFHAVAIFTSFSYSVFMQLSLSLLLGLVLLQSCLVEAVLNPPEVVYQFSHVNYTFEMYEDTRNYYDNEYYKNVLLAGVKVQSELEMYVSMPRWKPHVPATFGKIFYDHATHTSRIIPYPSWEMNKVGDPDALQSVLGFEVC